MQRTVPPVEQRGHSEHEEPHSLGAALASALQVRGALLQYPHRLLWYTSDSSPGHMSEFLKTLMQTSANRGGEGGTWRAPVHGAAEGVADHLRRHPLGLRLAGGGGDNKLAGAPRLRSDEAPLQSRSDPAHGCAPAPAPAPRTEALKASESLEEYQG